MSLAFLLLSTVALGAPADLRTTAEKTDFARTGRHDEAVRLCRALAAAHPGRARCFEFGRSPEGRPLVALAASADGTLTAGEARRRSRTVVVFQGAIHAGECDGKDAGFMLLRDLLGSPDGGPLRQVTAVFIPILNVDGHERFGPDQRPNQRGPVESGWRTTAGNLNLNRDYVKIDSPEMRDLLALLHEWDPIVYADLHATDGAQFEHDVSITIEPRFGYAEELRDAGRRLSSDLIERLTAAGHLPVDFYPDFRVGDDPASGFASLPAPPRFGHGYWAARNRLGLLLENHSWRPYGHRVHAAIDLLSALLATAARDGGAWRAAAERADRASAGLGGHDLALAWTAGDAARMIAFRGYAYVRETSTLIGRPIVRYDESQPQVWHVPLVEENRTTSATTLPTGGWIVPAAHAAWVEPKLRLHGIAFERWSAPRDGLAVEVFRASSAKLRGESYEGRQMLTVEGRWSGERRDLAAGALFIPAAQRAARIAAFLLEPASPDSLLAWGFFNAAFERKEYIEDYVLEPFARRLLETDAAVRAAFERQLEDAAFAGDPAARREFFYRRHPAFDADYRLYPVFRSAADR